MNKKWQAREYFKRKKTKKKSIISGGANCYGSTVLDKEIFIETVRDFRCLWDTNCPAYKERQTKINAWNSLSKMFNQDGKVIFVICNQYT